MCLFERYWKLSVWIWCFCIDFVCCECGVSVSRSRSDLARKKISSSPREPQSERSVTFGTASRSFEFVSHKRP